MIKSELLAPAGSFETMKAALAAGADAVYMGGMRFGARAYAVNGDEDTIKEAIRYVHLHDKKLYLTVNTLLKEEELEKELYSYLAPYYEEGLDAVIVQDPGVLSYVKKHFPDLHIHASTQMTITGPESAKLLEEMGCQRIVTARELSLEEIRQIRQNTSLEIESFVHGALCYCYSGQCLMSSIFGGRSGNRGRCAQPCRLPYQIYQNGKRQNNENSQFVLSPKDMCTVEILPQILEAGVNSLKIEGRMKKPEYTAGVVRIYRKYLDLYEKDPEHYRVSPEDLRELADLYNRDGFHTGYYRDHNGPVMMALKNEKLSAGQKSRNEALFKRIRETYVEQQPPVKLNGVLKLKCGQPAELSVRKISDSEMVKKTAYMPAEEAHTEEKKQNVSLTVTGGLVEPAQKQPLTEERVRKQIEKTGGTSFVFDHLDIEMDESVFVPMQTLNELRREALAKAEQASVSEYGRSLINEDTKDTADRETFVSYGSTHKNQNVPVDSWHAFSVAVETKEQLDMAIAAKTVENIYAALPVFAGKDMDEKIKDYIRRARKWGKKPYLALPHIVRREKADLLAGKWQYFITEGLEGYLVRSLESLAVLRRENLLDRAVTDANLYTYNREAQAYYRELGAARDTAPVELNSRELASRYNGDSEMIVYGYLPLMVSAQCIKKNLRNCSRKSEILILEDRYKKKFCVKCVCDFCYNIIYNSLPLGITKEADQIRRLGFGGIRLNFTLESPDQMKEILDGFSKIYLEKTEWSKPSDVFTKGHFKRGVE